MSSDDARDDGRNLEECLDDLRSDDALRRWKALETLESMRLGAAPRIFLKTSAPRHVLHFPRSRRRAESSPKIATISGALFSVSDSTFCTR